jgi:predicted RNA-binding protein associated with RNAse of E/G family
LRKLLVSNEISQGSCVYVCVLVFKSNVQWCNYAFTKFYSIFECF